MSTAGDLVRTANAAAVAFPPLQAALGLVSYIDESIALFKSNGNEIKAIGDYSQRLSEVLLDRSVNPGSTSKFVKVIESIHAYVQKVSKKRITLQYLKRRNIAEKLQGFRNNLWEEFLVFSLASDIEAQNFHQAAESARERDMAETQAAFQKLSSDIKDTSAGVRDLADSLGLSKNEAYKKEVLAELQEIPADSEHEEERTVLRESLRLTKSLLSPHYKWFRETFNATEFSQSQVKNGLAEGIADVIPDLRDSGLLAETTITELNYERSPIAQLTILFRVLNGRPRDAVLIRTFQRAISRHCNVQHLMREGLDL